HSRSGKPGDAAPRQAIGEVFSRRGAEWESPLEHISPHRKNLQLQSPMLGFSRDLLLDAIAGAERHGDELTDDPLFHDIAVEPWLARTNQVVLRFTSEPGLPRFARERIDFAGRHADRDRIVCAAVREKITPEQNPERLG